MLSPVLTNVARDVLRSVFPQSYAPRFAYNFDGIDDRISLGYRAINPEGDIDIEFSTGDTIPPIGVARCIVDQSISATFSLKEFYLQFNTSGRMQVTHGGSFLSSHTAASPVKPNTKYRVTIIGNTLTYYEDGVPQSINITRGTAREAPAQTKIGAWSLGGGFSGYYIGQLLDVKINGILYPISEKDYSIQLPAPANLGPELITPEVHEAPAIKGSHWTHLGGGRWQLVSDGSYNELRLLNNVLLTTPGLVEFEIESISGVIRCSAGTNVPVSSQFNSVGVKRWFYPAFSTDNIFTFSRNNGGQAVTAIIKNISFKQLYSLTESQLIINGDFSAGTTGWSVQNANSFSVVSGRGVLVTTPDQNSRVERPVVLEPGSYYEVSVDVVNITPTHSARINVIRGVAGNYAGIAGESNATATGKRSLVFLAPASDALIQIVCGNPTEATLTIDNVSVRKLNSLCNPIVLHNTTPDRWAELNPPNLPRGFNFTHGSNSQYITLL